MSDTTIKVVTGLAAIVAVVSCILGRRAARRALSEHTPNKP